LSGGTIPASGGTCTVTVAVTASTLGNYTNTLPAGAVTSSQGSNASAASATLVAISAQPVTGSWAIASFNGGGGNLKGNGLPETIKLTLTNPNTLALTNVGTTFSIAQPVLAFATPSNLSTTCGGTVTLNAGAGTGTLSGGTIPASGSCTITFDDIAAQPNIFFYGSANVTIPASNITSSQGITNNAAIVGGFGVQTGSAVAKSFAPNPIITGATSTLTLTINNYNASMLSPITLTDSLPSGMTVAPLPSASTTCSGGTLTAVAGSNSVQLSGGSLPAVAATATTSTSCKITVDVVGLPGVPPTPQASASNATPASKAHHQEDIVLRPVRVSAYR
jgi:hypothetical protein